MNNKNKPVYTDEPIQMGEEVPNFLPSSENLIFKKAPRQVTITLDQMSIEFFQKKGEKNNRTYTDVIQTFLINYVKRHQKMEE